MEKRKLKIILFTIMLISFFALSEKLYSTEISTCECAPLSYTINGKASGPGVDIANSIQKIIKTNDKINFYPWARGYMQLQREPNTVLFSTARTPEREKLFKWVGPLAQKSYCFYVKKGSKIKIKNLDDAKKYTIGVHYASNNEQFLRSNGFKKIDHVRSEDINLLKLNKDRIDLWYTDSAIASALIKQNSLEGAFEIRYVVQKIQLYYAFNINTPDKIVNKWQNALDTLRKNGTMRNIYKKYKMETLYPSQK